MVLTVTWDSRVSTDYSKDVKYLQERLHATVKVVKKRTKSYI
jgi:hypothetical protein